jgi:hypothetical protein
MSAAYHAYLAGEVDVSELKGVGYYLSQLGRLMTGPEAEALLHEVRCEFEQFKASQRPTSNGHAARL